MEQSIIASKIPPVLHRGPDFPFCRNPTVSSVPLSEEHLSSFSAEVVSANLLIHSYACCLPASGRPWTIFSLLLFGQTGSLFAAFNCIKSFGERESSGGTEQILLLKKDTLQVS